MFRGFSGPQRVTPLAERRVAAQLRGALTTLPSPWVVLANRRASGADGPPWVRFVALHPAKGIALVDTAAAEAALAPLEDFLARTGFPALQPGALPIVPVAIGPSEIGAIADIMDGAFPQGQPAIGNPNWCDAVVELLLAAPDLMLSPLSRGAQRPVAKPSQAEPSFHPAPQTARAEPPRPPQPPRAEPAPLAAAAPTPAAESESIRLVPPRVARRAEPQPKPQRQAQPEPPRVAAQPPRTPDVPQFLLQGDEPHGDEPRINLALEAGDRIGSSRQSRASRGRRDPSDRRDPTFGAGAGFGTDRDDASWRPLRVSRSRSALIPIAAGLLLVAAGAVALRYHQITSSQSANAVAQSAPPAPTASLTPPAMPSPLPTVSPPAPVVTSAATAPAPPPRPAPPIHAAATPPHPAPMPPVKKADADLPRDMLQPQIASAPPTPLPLPAAKQNQPQPVRTATAKPQSTEPAPADTDLPAAIAAVLHPGATPPAATASTTTAPQLATPSATAATAAAPAGGEVTVNGVSYVNGEQPHSLGAFGAPSPSTSPATPSPAAVASNAPPPAVAVPPGEVVISRAPNGTPIAQSTASGPLASPPSNVISTAPGYNATANHPSSGGIVATPVPGPSSGADNGNGAAANGPPTALQVAPATSNP
ncbi:MAG TPA: hypothetical protein VGR52_09475 [Stellaceae bacterium]|nr:hypothetical protein [Stellaceae bacterium]